VDARTGERGYETAGHRAAQDPADQDTVEMSGAAPSTGSTRDDARPAAPYPGRTGTDAPDPGMANEGMANEDMANEGMGDRGMADRGMAGRGMGDQGMGDQGMAGRGMADQDTIDRGMADQDTIDRGMADRDVADRDVGDQRMADRGTAERGDAGTGGDIALLDPQDAEEMRRRWSDTQARFVDDPREAVQTADGLVAELMQTLARSFSAHKNDLEAHWRSGGDPDTEELRQALQRYRSFFDRLLSA
jgi:hypothetical protein